MEAARTVLRSRRAVVLLLIALVVAVGFATGTIQRIDRGARTQTTTGVTQAARLNQPSYTQVAAYSHGYHCVKTTLAAFAEAHLTSGITTVKRAHRLSVRTVVGCDRGAVEDSVRPIAWYRMGAGDAMHDMFDEPSGRAACLTNLGCGAGHSTIRYFKAIEEGATP